MYLLKMVFVEYIFVDYVYFMIYVIDGLEKFFVMMIDLLRVISEDIWCEVEVELDLF